jgi:hypothetical protein
MIDLLNALLQWLDPAWVVDQFGDGDGLPFVLWTAIALTVGFTSGFFASKKLSGWVSKRTIAKGFSPDIKKAALEALDASGSVVIGDKFDALLAFEREGRGVFSFAFPIDDVYDTDTYQLTSEWRSYLNRHRKYLQ